jgi:hypothetical protein
MRGFENSGENLLLLLLNRLPPDITGGQGLKAFFSFFFTKNSIYTITRIKD